MDTQESLEEMYGIINSLPKLSKTQESLIAKLIESNIIELKKLVIGQKFIQFHILEEFENENQLLLVKKERYRYAYWKDLYISHMNICAVHKIAEDLPIHTSYINRYIEQINIVYTSSLSDVFDYWYTPNEIKIVYNKLNKMIEDIYNLRQQLIMANLVHVIPLARTYGKNDCALTLDLLQEGFLNVLFAADGFSTEKDTRFLTYSNYLVRQSILEHRTRAYRTITAPTQKLSALSKYMKSNQNPEDKITPEHVAENLHCDKLTAISLLQNILPPVSLSQMDTSDTMSLYNLLLDDSGSNNIQSILADLVTSSDFTDEERTVLSAYITNSISNNNDLEEKAIRFSVLHNLYNLYDVLNEKDNVSGILESHIEYDDRGIVHILDDAF